MSTLTALACTICGGALTREALRITVPDRFERHVGITDEGYSRSWIACEVCGAATNVQTPQNRIRLDTLAAGYYEVDFASSSVGEKFRQVMALPASASDNAQRVLRIHKFMCAWLAPATSARVLDIGGGTGVFLSRFLEEPHGRTWTAVAVEPDPIAAQHLRTLGSFEVTQALFSSRLGLGEFDLVTLNKVVEHVPNPVELVREAASALRAGCGVLYIEVPDKLTMQYRAPSDNILGALHQHLYDPVSVCVLLDRAGLATLRMERHFEPSGKITVAAFATSSSAIDRLAVAQKPS